MAYCFAKGNLLFPTFVFPLGLMYVDWRICGLNMPFRIIVNEVKRAFVSF